MAAAGDAGERAFTAWAQARRQALSRSAFLLTGGDLGRAEDLVQDALVKVAARWNRLERENPDAYARRILVRANVSWWRARRREQVRDQIPELAVSAEDEESADRRVVVAQALRRLTPRQRAVVVLRYYQDLTEAQVADTLGVSVGTVKSQVHAALARLRTAAPELAEYAGDGSS
ncbi:MAG: SigE family RNA polymerase sigma factor [Nocardioidaceae bacterium]